LRKKKGNPKRKGGVSRSERGLLYDVSQKNCPAKSKKSFCGRKKEIQTEKEAPPSLKGVCCMMRPQEIVPLNLKKEFFQRKNVNPKRKGGVSRSERGLLYDVS